MALVLADRVQEQTSTTGTGTINLDGAVSGFQTFVAGIGTGNTTYYCIVSGSAWEVGLGTVTDASPDTLSRTTILASSNSGSAISLSGTSTVFGDAPAALLGNAGLFGNLLSRPLPTSTNTGLTSWQNQGSSTIADSLAGVTMVCPSNGSQQGYHLRYKSQPSTPYTITAMLSLTTANFTNYCSSVFGFSDGTKWAAWELQQQPSAPGPRIIVQHGTNTGSGASVTNDFTSGAANGFTYREWFRISNNGTNYSFQWAADGVNWRTYYTVALGTFMTPTQVMFGMNSYAADGTCTLHSYIEA